MKINKEDIDWVWVDLDDTIWDFKTNSWEALALVYEYAGLEEAFGDVDTWRNTYQENNHRLWSLYNVGKITKEYLMVERFRKVLADAGYDNDEAIKMSAELSDVYLDKLASLKALVPGARELLDYLKSQGYKIGVISNGFYEVQHRKMVSSNIVDYFDAVVLSDDIGVNKPDKRIFDYALQKSNAEACRTLIVGDNPDTDIIGAMGAGWHAIYFNRNGEGASINLVNAIEVFNLEKIHDIL
ncbi:MAG: YjjG family noncanonical pyrimidine nucleotidase [Muribaculaceae bacterium]|nr:YjjG family noncanonical pyrimidine nucleotidase [Muribaculaceae bacterium]